MRELDVGEGGGRGKVGRGRGGGQSRGGLLTGMYVADSTIDRLW